MYFLVDFDYFDFDEDFFLIFKFVKVIFDLLKFYDSLGLINSVVDLFKFIVLAVGSFG